MSFINPLCLAQQPHKYGTDFTTQEGETKCLNPWQIRQDILDKITHLGTRFIQVYWRLFTTPVRQPQTFPFVLLTQVTFDV